MSSRMHPLDRCGRAAGRVFVPRRERVPTQAAGSSCTATFRSYGRQQQQHHGHLHYPLRMSFSPSNCNHYNNYLHARLFSTSTQPNPSLRKFVKPFLLRCHPDVQTAQDAKQVNLKAIQNLNSYLDSIEALTSGKFSRLRRNEEEVVEIDFVIQVEENRFLPKKRNKGKEAPASRRKVHLTWPDRDIQDRPSLIDRHTRHELAKLLRVAGLEVPMELADTGPITTASDEDKEDDEINDGMNRMDEVWAQTLDLDKETERMEYWQNKYGRQRKASESQYARMAAARRRFAQSIDWEKVDRLYERAWQEVQADIATRGVIKDSRERRMQFIADILSRVVPDKEISIVDRFCAMRRLSLLLDHNFDRLELEDCSAMWEQVTIRLMGERPYNTSSSAMHKRRQQQADNGFSFTLLADGKVSVEIPLDFGDEELLQEWERNLWDFYELVEDDIDDIFIKPQSASA
eukprot:scaffold968_cov171-Amphora_coffeaeformis.AAC.6